MSRANGKFIIPLFLAAVFPLAAAARGSTSSSAPEFLNFDELVALSETDEPPEPLQHKLDNLLNTPFLGGDAAAQPRRPSDEGLGPLLRVADYRDAAKDLAHALNMNYVFGVEFVEVDRLDDLGIDPVQLEDPELAKQMQEEFKPDPVRYRGLHGNAILSPYPIEHARIYRLPVCHTVCFCPLYFGSASFECAIAV